jgi:hypothetical protein
VSRLEKQSKSLGAALSKRIARTKRQLRRRITNDPQLKKDFDFLIGETGWRSDLLLARLFWNSNMMHADSRTVLGKMRKESWPIKRGTLEKILKDAHALAKQIELVNETKFSPGRTVIFRDEKDARLSRRKERDLQDNFARLPQILCGYAEELGRNVFIGTVFSRRNATVMEYIVKSAKETSLFERIRVCTGKYHATHLLRLVNAARMVGKLPPLEERAFFVWLNRLKERHSTESARQVPPDQSKH